MKDIPWSIVTRFAYDGSITITSYREPTLATEEEWRKFMNAIEDAGRSLGWDRVHCHDVEQFYPKD